MNNRDLLKKFLVESLMEMKLDVAGGQAFAPRSQERHAEFDLGLNDGSEDACPECGGGPEACDPMCPIGGEGDMGPDPDRYRL